LFYYFIFNKNTIVPREKIIDAFWPEKDYNEAGHLLRDYIYMIKKAFNNNKIIVYSDKGYKLSSDINWEIDYYRMKEKYNTADVARKNNSIDDALKYIGEGLSLCN
jgi:two-component SAPR family response regulator